MEGQTPRKRSRLRRLARAVTVVVILGATAVAALPWVVGMGPVRDRLVARINREIAPSKLTLQGLSASWAGSIRLNGLTLKNGAGKTLIDAPRASIDRGIIALAVSPTRLGTITIEGAALDIERRTDGSIDIVEAISPRKSDSSTPPSRRVKDASEESASSAPVDVTLRITRGTLRLKTPELAEPLAADGFDMEVAYPAAQGKNLTFRIRLAKPPGGAGTETLGIDGEFDHHPGSAGSMALAVKGEQWPLALASQGVNARGRLDGLLKASMKGETLITSGDAKLLGFTAEGPTLQGDTLAFDAISAVWDVIKTEEAWKVTSLGIVTPVMTFSAVGTLTSSPSTVTPESRVDGRVDLAALSRQLPNALRIREGLKLEHGHARFVIRVKSDGTKQTASIEADVSDLTARDVTHAFALQDPASVVAKATRTESGVTVESLNVKTAFLDLTGAGDLDKGVKVSGSIDLGGLEAQFRELIDFGGVRMAGRGRIAADFRKTPTGFVGRSAAEVKGVQIAGLTQAPIVRDSVRLDAAVSGPADTTGLPTGWENARVNGIAGPDKLSFVGKVNKQGVVSVSGSASLPIVFSQTDGRADVVVVGRMKESPDGSSGFVELDEFRAVVRPADPKLSVSGTFSLAARGKLDLDNDNLELFPLPTPGSAHPALSLAPEGLTYHGVRKTPIVQRAGKGLLVGELSALEGLLQAWTGREPGGYGGPLMVKIGMGPGKNRLNIGVTLTLGDFSRPTSDGKGRRSEGPVVLAFSGGYAPDGDRFTVNASSLSTRYARIEAAGKIDDPLGTRLTDLQGQIAPAWEALSALGAESVEPGFKMTGQPRAFRLQGPLGGAPLFDIVNGLDAEVGLDVTSADAFGLRLGPAPLIVRAQRGRLSVEPIRTTLNGGEATLLPGLICDEKRGIAITLAAGSGLKNVQINDEVSKRVLTYIAPVLDKATEVHGTVEMALESADFPIATPDSRRVRLLGQLVFQNVVFAPGPFAKEVLTLTGQPDSPGLKLQKPVQLAIANGRVYQRGLEIPIRKDAIVTLDGSVGFDETLDLKAHVPITSGMLGVKTGLDTMVTGQKITVPIDGTVSKPRVNKRALQMAVRELSKSLFKKELSNEAGNLLNQLVPGASQGRDAGAQGSQNAGQGAAQGLEDQLLRRLIPKRR